jgi:hypothetical protein
VVSAISNVLIWVCADWHRVAVQTVWSNLLTFPSCGGQPQFFFCAGRWILIDVATDVLWKSIIWEWLCRSWKLLQSRLSNVMWHVLSWAVYVIRIRIPQNIT